MRKLLTGLSPESEMRRFLARRGLVPAKAPEDPRWTGPKTFGDKLKEGRWFNANNAVEIQRGEISAESIRKDVSKWEEKKLRVPLKLPEILRARRLAAEERPSSEEASKSLEALARSHEGLVRKAQDLAAKERAPIGRLLGIRPIYDSPGQDSPGIGANFDSQAYAASAEVMNTHYSRVERYTAGKRGGNLPHPDRKMTKYTSVDDDISAAFHISGLTTGSPWVSTTGHTASLRKSTDTSQGGVQEILRNAPKRDTFMVPSELLYRPDQVRVDLAHREWKVDQLKVWNHLNRGLPLGESEHEQLFRGTTLDDYRIFQTESHEWKVAERKADSMLESLRDFASHVKL